MPAPSERLLALQKQVSELEQVISAFESMNGNMRMRRANASDHVREICDRHISQNTRTILAMQQSLAALRQEIARLQ